MSIFFDFVVGPPGRRFRRAVDDDKTDIELIVDRKHTDQLFGEADIGLLIELSTLSICMIDENKEVVGFMALCDYPNVPGVAPDDWETWMRNMFQKYYLSRNTLFVRFMCCKDSVLEYFLEEACTSVFHNDVYLINICLIPFPKCPPENVTRYQVLKKRTMYKYVARRSDDSDSSPHFMLVAMRHDYCPRLKIRRAVEEDNDDIVQILDKKCPQLKEHYGSYYISELIGRHPESKRKIIVPEYQDHAVGVMCLNSDINYKKLQSLYELRPYYGLMKATPLEKEQLKRNNVLLSTYGEPIMTGKFSPFIRPSELNEEHSGDSFQTNPEKSGSRSSIQQRKQIKVNFKRSSKKTSPFDAHRENVVHISDEYSAKVFFVRSPSLTSYKSYENLMLEEDPFDYEIVNIDKSLLSLAEAFSHDLLNITENKSWHSSTTSIAIAPSEPQICRRKRRQSAICKIDGSKESELNLYSGEPNAFMIELFGLRDDVDEKDNSMELLVAAFEIMKDYDYCVIRVPSSENTFSLLQHFTYVPVKQKCCSEHCLYIAHRAAVLGKLRVREAEFIDIPLIARFLQNIEGSETIYTIEHSILDRDSYQAYVFMSGLSVIGIGILEPPEQLNFIRTKYNTDPYHNHKYHFGQSSRSGFAAVKAILVYPVFEVHYRFFVREMMRLTGCSSLMWMTAYRNKLVAHKANSLASAMVPLLPRSFDIDYSRMPELNKLATMTKNMLPFSTWFLDKKLTSVPLVTVNKRILIIGASKTCMAFLNALLFSNASTYLNFTNVTLISTHGLPYMRHNSTALEMMFPKHLITSEKYLKSVPYTYYVNTINGTVVEINRQDKYVTLTNGTKYYYDVLFLFFGKQYQHPDYLKPLMQRTMHCTENKPYVRMDIPNKYVEPDYINYNTPHNVFIINHVVQASNALKHVRKLVTEGYDFTVLVYGGTLHAYCCLTALLEMSVPPESILFVDPFPPENPDKARVSVFYNANVDKTVSEVLNTLNIEVYRSYYFQSWTTVDNIVTHVDFLSQHRFVRLECTVFFYYGKRGVNTQAFLAVNKSGVAYDGGILIDHQYRTRDPSIYAAGPCTAYHRKYFADLKKQKYYDSFEVGEKLGHQIRNELDPLFTDKSQLKRSCVRFSTDPAPNYTFGSDVESTWSESSPKKESDKTNKQLPDFVKPKVKYCRLPGGLQYLDVRSPGKKIPHYYVQSLNYNGVVMETFKTGYFKLHLTKDFIVDGITCLTCEKFGLENFKHLYGKSSVILNHVHLRYTTKKLDDFFEYFQAPWAHFLYHDQADELFAMVKELFPKGSTRDTGETLTEALRVVSGVFADTTKKSKSHKKLETSPYIEAVTEYVIQWISHNNMLLPMYLHPSDKADFVYDMGRHPMFRRKRNSITKLIRKVF